MPPCTRCCRIFPRGSQNTLPIDLRIKKDHLLAVVVHSDVKHIIYIFFVLLFTYTLAQGETRLVTGIKHVSVDDML